MPHQCCHQWFIEPGRLTKFRYLHFNEWLRCPQYTDWVQIRKLLIRHTHPIFQRTYRRHTQSCPVLRHHSRFNLTILKRVHFHSSFHYSLVPPLDTTKSVTRKLCKGYKRLHYPRASHPTVASDACRLSSTRWNVLEGSHLIAGISFLSHEVGISHLLR